MDWQPKNADLAGVLRRERRDDLTGLLSMMDFMERADREIARGPATFLYFNVENFRLMNQEYGFQAGNQLLVRIAEALLETFGPVPMARLNDDRFIVMTRSTGLEEHIQAVVETVDQIEARMSLAVKVGIYDPPPDVTDVALIMDRAKLACDSIKGIYDKRCAHFTKGLETQRSLRTYIVTNFYRALEEGWIEVWYQPEIRAATREVCGFEALARWRDPERGIISPGDFIPVLERAHLINRLDLYVIQRVCSDQQKGKERPSWKSSHISVNLSRVDFQLSNMLEEIQSICRAYDVPEGYLHIEITESALNDNDEFLRHEIQRFHDAGFELWMDDFGSGYSSLNNLKDFQFDLLKIDMGFLRDFDTKPQARVILEAIVDMAKKLGIHTLCEGVETEEQYKFLKDIGCEVLQGYLFSPPVPYSDEHTGEVSGSKENLLVIEGTEAEDYFRTIGSFNVLDADPLRFSKDSWGLAIAILECRDDGSCRYLYANDRVREMAIPDGFHNLEEAIRDRRHRDDLMQPERRFWNLVERALQSGKPESMENFINGRAYSVRMVRIARDEPRGVSAIAYQIIDLSDWGIQHQQRFMDVAMRHMLQIYTRVDLYSEDGTAENLVVDASQQRVLDIVPFTDEGLRRYADMYIDDKDRENFLSFYDMTTVEERSHAARNEHVTAVFNVYDELTNRPEPQMFTLIPFRLEGRHYVLSCMRRIDNLDRGRSTKGF